MTDEMQEIIADFVTEAEESLDRIDPLFVELETRGDDRDILNDIFRCMHTLKGAAGFLGFRPVVDVAHASENILKKLRDGEIVVSRPLVDAILRSVDMLRLLVAGIKKKEDVAEDTAPVIAALDAALSAATDGQGAGGSRGAGSRPPAAGDGGPGNAGVPPAAPEGTRGEASPPVAADGEKAPETRESAQNLRVDVQRIDKVMDLTGEVVLVRNRLLNIVNSIGSKYGDDPSVESLFDTVSFLDLVTSDMQLAVMKMRMQAIKKVFGKFPRLVRDIAGPLGKEVELRISGEDTEVDKTVIEHIGDPMVHIIRNSIDHGLETTAERRAGGKPEKGVIRIDACQKGNQVVIEVRDDGKGIDLDRVRSKAVQRGLVGADEAARMTDDAATALIFLPGFSTVDVATALSGRGVGMDVVKTNIAKLNGYVEVKTRKGEGTTFRISIPLTLAIIRALMVNVSGARYAIPLAVVEEIIRVSAGEIGEAAGRKVLVIRDKVHPLFELAPILGGSPPAESRFRYAVVVTIGESRFCLAVDGLSGEEEVVIKPVDGMEAGSAHMIGATITGDGRVVLILDLASISRSLPATVGA